jgi:hypothetical protein
MSFVEIYSSNIGGKEENENKEQEKRKGGG